MPQQNVEKMAKEADELHRGLYPEQYGDPPLPPDSDPAAPPETPPVIPDVIPPVTPPEPTPPAEPPAPVEGTPVSPAPAPTPPAETPPPAPEPWEQRYNTLKGKYDAEVPRLFSEINSLKQQINQPPSPPPTPAPAPAPAAPLTIKEILSGDPALEAALVTFKEDYPDVADLLVKLTERASTMTSAKINEMVNTVADQTRTVQEFQAESRTQHFWEVVNKDLPDWQVIRDDPDFAIWLNGTEPYTGLPRAALAQDALQKLDAHRVVSIYNGFRTHKGAAPTRPSATTTIPPAAPGADLIAPPSGGRTAPTATPTNTEPPITSAYIQKFYSDAAMGKYRTRQAEFDKIEGRINKAVSEGRVL